MDVIWLLLDPRPSQVTLVELTELPGGLAEAAARSATVCQHAAPCWRLLAIQMPIGLTVGSAAGVSAVGAAALLMVLLDAEQHALMLDAGVHSGDSSYTATLTVLLGCLLAMLQHGAVRCRRAINSPAQCSDSSVSG